MSPKAKITEPTDETMVFCECGFASTDMAMHFEHREPDDDHDSFVAVPADRNVEPLPDDDVMTEVLTTIWGNPTDWHPDHR